MMKPTTPVAVRLNKEMRQEIKKKAYSLGLDESNFIRLAISLFLSNNSTLSKENIPDSKEKE